MRTQEQIREAFDVWWGKEVLKVKANADAILRERMEAYLTEQGLTADIDLTIDWDIDMQVAKLEAAGRAQEGGEGQ